MLSSLSTLSLAQMISSSSLQSIRLLRVQLIRGAGLRLSDPGTPRPRSHSSLFCCSMLREKTANHVGKIPLEKKTAAARWEGTLGE